MAALRRRPVLRPGKIHGAFAQRGELQLAPNRQISPRYLGKRPDPRRAIPRSFAQLEIPNTPGSRGSNPEDLDADKGPAERIKRSDIGHSVTARTLINIASSQVSLATALKTLAELDLPAPMTVPSPTMQFDEYLPQVTQDLDRVTTHAAALPGKSDLAFHRTLDRKLAKELDEASERILALTRDLLDLVDRKKNSKRRRMDDEDDVVEGYKRGVVDSVDSLLEDAVSPQTLSFDYA